MMRNPTRTDSKLTATSPHRRRLTLALAAGVILLALVTTLVATAGEPPAPVPPPANVKPTIDQPGPRADGFDPSIASAVGVSRRPDDPADAMPTKRAHALSDAVRFTGVNPALARRAITTDRDAVFVVPDAHGACLVWLRGGAACADSRHVANGYLLFSDFCPAGLAQGQARVTGLLPDDASGMEWVTQDGIAHQFRVTGNVYSLVFDPADPATIPAAIRWTSGGELRQVAAPVPPDVATECGPIPGLAGGGR
jgi:hypothetical protein